MAAILWTFSSAFPEMKTLEFFNEISRKHVP